MKGNPKNLKYFAYGVAISVAGAILADYVRDWMRKPAGQS